MLLRGVVSRSNNVFRIGRMESWSYKNGEEEERRRNPFSVFYRDTLRMAMWHRESCDPAFILQTRKKDSLIHNLARPYPGFPTWELGSNREGMWLANGSMAMSPQVIKFDTCPLGLTCRKSLLGWRRVVTEDPDCSGLKEMWMKENCVEMFPAGFTGRLLEAGPALEPGM